MRRLTVMVVAVFFFALVGPAGLVAQDATPPAGVGEVIDSSECRVTPRSAEEVFALWSDEDGAGTPEAETRDWYADEKLTAAPVPLGLPADEKIVAAVNSTVREGYACANADDPDRILALVSDGMLSRLGREFGPAGSMTLETVRSMLAAPAEPLPVQDRYRLVAITDVSVMNDGRVAAFVVEDDPTEPPEGPTTELDLFVEERGRWVVDGVLLFTGADAYTPSEVGASDIAGATAVGDLPGVTGQSYRSPSYGYALAWDAGWTVEHSTTVDGRDQLHLSRGGAAANFNGVSAGAGTTLPADPSACLEVVVRRLATDPDIANFGRALASVGVPIGSGSNVAAEVYVGYVTSQLGNTSDVVFFLSCRSLGPNAVLFITYAVGPEEAGEAAPLFRALDSSIVLSGDATSPA